jgi:hypothetical protein
MLGGETAAAPAARQDLPGVAGGPRWAFDVTPQVLTPAAFSVVRNGVVGLLAACIFEEQQCAHRNPRSVGARSPGIKTAEFLRGV